MKVGALRQALPLGIVAAGAVLFLTYQLARMGEAGLRRPQAQKAAQAVAEVDRPDVILGDPFGRLSLRLARAEGPTALPASGSARRREIGSGSTGLGPLLVEPLPRALPGDLPSSAKEQGGKGRKLDERPRSSVKVTAIVAAEERVAYVATNGGVSEMVKPGTRLAGGEAVVVAVEDDCVTIRFGKRLIRVRPGDEVNL